MSGERFQFTHRRRDYELRSDQSISLLTPHGIRTLRDLYRLSVTRHAYNPKRHLPDTGEESTRLEVVGYKIIVASEHMSQISL